MSDKKTYSVNTNHKDWFEDIMLRINPTQALGNTVDAPLRPQPRFAQLHHFREGERFTASIPVARRTWWYIAILILLAVWLAAPSLAIYFGWGPVYNSRGQFRGIGWSPWPLILTIIILAIVTYASLRAVFPRISVTASEAGITVGKYRYSWDAASGLREGYSIGGVQKSDRQGGRIGLRMSYGQWGHDLPYMVNSYYSAAYILWLNELFLTIKHKPDTVNDPSAGIKLELY